MLDLRCGQTQKWKAIKMELPLNVSFALAGSGMTINMFAITAEPKYVCFEEGPYKGLECFRKLACEGCMLKLRKR
jgi:hypothetical protein